MEREIRYQGAIIRTNKILLIKQQFGSGYKCWNIPGGGKKVNETEEQCVVREMQEETNLLVEIECLLIDGPSHAHSQYKRFKTYLCTPIAGEAKPDGDESIDVRWFNLSDVSQWRLEQLNSETTFVMLQRIREALGFD